MKERAQILSEEEKQGLMFDINTDVTLEEGRNMYAEKRITNVIVVSNPTPVSTLKDIVNVTDIPGLQNQIINGMRDSAWRQSMTLYPDNAMKAAKADGMARIRKMKKEMATSVEEPIDDMM